MSEIIITDHYGHNLTAGISIVRHLFTENIGIFTGRKSNDEHQWLIYWRIGSCAGEVMGISSEKDVCWLYDLTKLEDVPCSKLPVSTNPVVNTIPITSNG